MTTHAKLDGTRERIIITGYDVVALVECDHGTVAVLNNNSSHYIVVEIEPAASGEARTRLAIAGETILLNLVATVAGSFTYSVTGDVTNALRQALELTMKIALTHTAMPWACDEDEETK